MMASVELHSQSLKERQADEDRTDQVPSGGKSTEENDTKLASTWDLISPVLICLPFLKALRMEFHACHHRKS
ncbi:unnamed protein product [Hymenolepis diminuta]|uniref:Uncharacterized protein n=1 Tax=Hymenolepis diminuta TaxID=6216 RepID=A0A564ZB51_HYMDI|nr:unnamed protein product [Hymenolepis diminuta]